MTGVSLGLRTGSYGSLQLIQNGNYSQVPVLVRRPSKALLYNPRDKERGCLYICRHLGRGKVAMLLMLLCGLFIFVFGYFTVYKGGNITNDIEDTRSYVFSTIDIAETIKTKLKNRSISRPTPLIRNPPVPHLQSSYNLKGKKGSSSTAGHPCDNFAFPPPPPTNRRRTGPRPCPVCYIPVEQAIASMPISPSESPVVRTLRYAHNENMFPREPEGGSDFGGYPSLEERDASFDIKETMKVHCGFVKGSRPGRQTGFDFDEEDLLELDQYHDIIVASAIFGNYDVIQQPRNISRQAKKNIPFYMFIDKETEIYMRNASILDSSRRVGLWRIIVVRNIPYADSRRNGKIPKLLLHRIFPNIRYSIWIDGKLELVADPYLILERFLWRPNATFAISKHYTRFDVFVEAEANKVAGKYENASIDRQVQFYQYHDGLTHYSLAKLPITSDVPEGCVIIREHIPITNLFTCLWFNEVDRFTSRDQLSFSTVRDKIMAKVDWSINMFLDCERRNFVIQAYHRDVLENMPPPSPPVVVIRRPNPPVSYITHKPPMKKNPRHGRGDRRSGSRRHRKVVDNVVMNQILFQS
ncbi:putative hexosyltransferase MUCI70 [Trifolium repens]|nr:putative hexosyltransferase MUCI70 [Trifolium repens]